MEQVAFLYKGDEPGSVALLSALGRLALTRGVRLWSDLRTTDPGFADELSIELGRSSAIIHCIGLKGPGFYQTRNEIPRTVQALAAQPERRLLVVLLEAAQPPPEFVAFDDFKSRTVTVRLPADGPGAEQVLTAAAPSAKELVDDSGVKDFASDAIDRTVGGDVQSSLTIVVGPYAYAESIDRTATPYTAIQQLLDNKGLPGKAPWLDVMGSVARATNRQLVFAAGDVAKAQAGGSRASAGQLGVYLRLLAANWGRRPGKSRLYIVACDADTRVDMPLRSDVGPVQHLRLVHTPRETQRVFAERVVASNGTLQRNPVTNLDRLEPTDRVVLIKPLGCFEKPERALITAEHWRASSACMMELPLGVAQDMANGFLLVLGAGAFAPSLQIVFQSLLRDALKRVDDNSDRYMIHSPEANVEDPLHNLEAALARASSQTQAQRRATYDAWLRDTYGLELRLYNPLLLLAWLDTCLAELPPARKAG